MEAVTFDQIDTITMHFGACKWRMTYNHIVCNVYILKKQTNSFTDSKMRGYVVYNGRLKCLVK